MYRGGNSVNLFKLFSTPQTRDDANRRVVVLVLNKLPILAILAP